MKRSVSPQTTVADTPSKRRNVFGIFSRIKDAFNGSALAGEHADPDTTREEIQQPFPNTFTSHKRQMSVQGTLHSLNSTRAVPRSSELLNRNGSYQLLANTFQVEKDAANGDLELRRMSVAVPALDDGPLKETSPSIFIPKNRILPTNPMEMVLDEEEEMPIVIEHEFAPLYKDDSGNLVRPPFINLDPRERYHLLQLKKSVEASEYLQSRLKYMVDPNETTSIIRADNKVDASTQTHDSEFVQRSLNFNQLRTKLALKNRKQLKSKKGRGFNGLFLYEPSAPPEKVTMDEKFKGYLGSVGKPEFKDDKKKDDFKRLHDDDTREDRHIGKRRSGVENARQGKSLDTTLDKDFVERSEKISNLIKLKDTGVQNREKPRVGPSAGFNFEINKASIDSIMEKRKEDDKLVERGSAPDSASSVPAVAPSTPAFLFGKPSDTLAQPAKRSRDSPERETSTTKPSFGESTTAPSFSFGKQPTGTTAEKAPDATLSGFGGFQASGPVPASNKRKSSIPKMAFDGFGGFKAPASTDAKADTPKTAILFGAPKAADLTTTKDAKNDASKPKFPFGASKADELAPKTTPSFSFGAKEGLATPLFGAKTTSTEGDDSSNQRKMPKPAFDLSGASVGDDKLKPSVSFGLTTDIKATPAFSFGGSSKEAESKPSFGKPIESSTNQTTSLFGDAKSKTDADTSKAPLFNFGASSTAANSSASENKENGAEKQATPKLNFGASTAPAFSFSSAPTTISAESSATPGPLTVDVPNFQFGAKPAETGSGNDAKSDVAKEAPKFSFGQAKPAETPKTPGFDSGATKPAPAFSFGQSSTLPKTGGSGFSFSKAATPLSQTAESDSKPTSAFGLTQPTQPTTTATPSFSFGGTAAQSGNNKPAFSFGQTATPDPALIFGGSAKAPLTGFNFSVNNAATPLQLAAPISTQKPAGGFSFSNNAVAGSRSATPTSGFNFGATNTSFGAPQNNSPAPFAGAGGAGMPAGFGNASRSATPNTSGFGQNSAAPGLGGQPQGGFSFSNNALGGAAGFNSAPGSFGQNSRENTPPVFGGAPANNGFGANPGQPFTPPLAMNGRKMAQMRSRKRY